MAVKTKSRKGSIRDHFLRVWLDLKRSRDATQIHAMRHSRVALPGESLLLAKWASKRLAKGSRGKYTDVEPLFAQLESLRSLIPYRRKCRKACVISNAINYLGRLKRRHEKLRHGLLGNASCSEMFCIPPQVEVRIMEEGLQIHVQCEKSSGLIPDLLEALQKLGLAMEVVNISCSDRRSLNLDAKCKQVGGAMGEIAAETVRRVLSETIKMKQI